MFRTPAKCALSKRSGLASGRQQGKKIWASRSICATRGEVLLRSSAQRNTVEALEVLHARIPASCLLGHERPRGCSFSETSSGQSEKNSCTAISAPIATARSVAAYCMAQQPGSADQAHNEVWLFHFHTWLGWAARSGLFAADFAVSSAFEWRKAAERAKSAS
jgi:hypothetical protein